MAISRGVHSLLVLRSGARLSVALGLRLRLCDEGLLLDLSDRECKLVGLDQVPATWTYTHVDKSARGGANRGEERNPWDEPDQFRLLSSRWA